MTDFEAVQAQFVGHVGSYLEKHGKVKKYGGYWHLESCPFCGEANRFTVWKKGNYKCYGAKCGETGGLFDLIITLENLREGDKYGALVKGAEYIGYNLVKKQPENEAEYRKWQRLSKLMEVSCEFYQNNLSESSIRFLQKKRGRTKKMIKDGCYGQSVRSNPLWKYLESEGFSRAEQLSSGLVRDKGNGVYDLFSSEQIIYPIKYRGRVSYFRSKNYLYHGTEVSKANRKEYQLPLDKHLWGCRLLGEDEIHGDKVIFVEGEEDWMSLKQANPKLNVVAALGQLGKKDMIVIKANLKQGATIYTAFDPGPGGRKYENLFLEELFGTMGFNILRMQWDGFTDGDDIDDFLVKSSELRNCEIAKVRKCEREKEKKREDESELEALVTQGEKRENAKEKKNTKNLTTEGTENTEEEKINSFYLQSMGEIVGFLMENARDILEERMIEIKAGGIDGIFDMKKKLQPIITYLSKLDEKADRDMYLKHFMGLMGGQKTEYYKFMKHRIDELRGKTYKSKSIDDEDFIEVSTEIIERDGIYRHRTYDSKGKMKFTEISNFVMELLSMIEYEGKLSYEVKLINEQGEVTHKPLEFESTQRTDKRSFCNAISEHGRYAFYGNNDQLQKMWMYVTMNHAKLEGIIRRRSYTGFLEEDNVWILGNCGFSEGEFFAANENGDVKIGTDIFRCDPIQIYSGKKPELYIDKPTTEKDVKEIIDHYWTMMDYRGGELIQDGDRERYGEYNTFLAFGWLVGSVYLQDWVKEVGFFPFLEFFGQKGSGKTYAMQLLLRCMGLDKEKAREGWGGSRANMAESMKYIGNYPYFADEYFNAEDPKQAERVMFMRGAYTRNPYTRGLRTGGKESLPMRATFCYAGQSRPNDAALLDRTLIIWKQVYKKKANVSFDWLWKEHSDELSRIMYWILSNKKKGSFDVIRDSYYWIMEQLESSCPEVDIRARSNYAVVAASFLIFPYVDHLSQFMEWLVREVKTGFVRVEGENIIYQFLSNVDTVWRGNIGQVVDFDRRGDEEFLYIAFSEAFSAWQADRGMKISEDITEKEMREYMKHDPSGYYQDQGRKNLHNFGEYHKKRSIKIQTSLLPDNLKEAIDWGYLL